MPGEPAETMIGVGAVGFGVLLLAAAVKNFSPVALIRNAVTTGDIDISKLPNLVSKISATFHQPPLVDKAIADIRAKDSTLADAIQSELNNFDSNTPYSQTKHFFDLMSQARSEGFNSQVDAIENYVNNLVRPASTAAPSSGGRIV